MKHLTDMELEEFMRIDNPDSEHLRQCKLCRSRLDEKRALASRVQSAFASVKSPAALAERIRADLQLDMKRAQRPLHFSNSVNVFLRRFALPTAAAAAIGLVFLIGVYTLKPSAAEAARAELVDIHTKNIAGNHEFYTASDPAKLAAYFKDKLDFVPNMPAPGKGMALRGCCVRHFKDQVVGSYVVDTPQGVMSIVVVTDQPQSMGMVVDKPHNGYTFWRGDFATSNMVTVRLGQYSYCAVGEISHDYLLDLLTRVLPDSNK
jgi:anti-sigma factor RsiW